MKRQHTLLFPQLCVFTALHTQIPDNYLIIQGIDFLYNVQHDCLLGKCTMTGKQPLMQERVESGLLKTIVEHGAVNRFIINTHAFHNAHLLRAILPRPLVAPNPVYQNRLAKHIEIAGNLRVTQEIKRATTKAHAAQRKLEAANSVDGSGPESKKRKRARMVVNRMGLDGTLDNDERQEIVEQLKK